MGFLYADGRGVPQNFEKSVDWHHKAAEQGLAGAQSHLGYLYAVGGKIVKRNPTEACKWFCQYLLVLHHTAGLPEFFHESCHRSGNSNEKLFVDKMYE